MKFGIATLFLWCLFLTACGENNVEVLANNASYINIQRSGLPPDPGAAATSTLIGIDKNGNGVRDEVERVVSSFSITDADFASNLRLAAAVQTYLSEVAADSAKAVHCADIQRSDERRQKYPPILFESLTFDTVSRFKKKLDVDNDIDPRELSPDSNCGI